MRIGLIDFGTNTLRLNIFETHEDKYFSIYDFAIYSKIVENTVGTSLSQDGIEHIVQAIEEHQQACRHYRCDRIECFSTASLRYIDNAAEVLDQVEFRSGIKIKMITGDEEARYDYLALKSVSDEKHGVGCDLGGGSLQVFTYGEYGPNNSASFPLGSSRTAARFCRNPIPTIDEIAKIKENVGEYLSDENFEPSGKTLFAMGGTAKSVMALCNRLDTEGNVISLKGLNKVMKSFAQNPEKALEIIKEVAPNRVRTLLPGMAVLSGVMEFLKCEEMSVHSVGVREGFMESILNDKIEPTPSILELILGAHYGDEFKEEIANIRKAKRESQ